MQLYVHDLATGARQIVSTTASGAVANGHVTDGFWSDDETKVAFTSEATNLSPADSDAVLDVYVKDLTSGQLELASVTSTGEKGNSQTQAVSMNSGGYSNRAGQFSDEL